MSIAPALQRYLTVENIQYDVVPYDARAYRRGMSDFGGIVWPRPSCCGAMLATCSPSCQRRIIFASRI
jgi:hypothetical protein